MKLAVAIRQVPSSEARITVSPQTNQVDLRAVEWVISPYDEYALEEALRIRERLGGSVVVVCLGPDRARNALKTALATGADSAFHISDPSLDQADSYVTARALAAFLRRGQYDLILCGNKSIDDDMGYVGIALAEFLDLPHVSSVTKLEIRADLKLAKAHREVEGGTEVVETSLPAVFCAQKGLNEPRYPSLPGMMKAGRKPIPVLKPSELGLDPATLLPRTRVLKATLPPERKGGRIIEGAPPDAVRELARALREEAKVI
jgi:electron transfer flavoprotein beta subunit